MDAALLALYALSSETDEAGESTSEDIESAIQFENLDQGRGDQGQTNLFVLFSVLIFTIPNSILIHPLY